MHATNNSHHEALDRDVLRVDARELRDTIGRAARSCAAWRTRSRSPNDER